MINKIYCYARNSNILLFCLRIIKLMLYYPKINGGSDISLSQCVLINTGGLLGLEGPTWRELHR